MSAVVRMKGLSESLNAFEKQLVKAISPKAKWQQQFKTAFKRITLRWKGGIQKRVPVDTSHLKQSWVQSVTAGGGWIRGEVGTNVPYAKHLEFGTDYIAGGKVKALGESPNITDADAIHTWKAKQADEIRTTSFEMINGKLYNNPNKFKHRVVRGPQEQMPFLRPSWNEIEPWAIGEIRKVLHRAMKELYP